MKYVVSLIVSLIALMMDAMPTKNAYAAKHIINIANEIPYECEVQWLESTGTQFILLENVLVNGIDVFCLPEYTRATGWGCIGRWNNGSRADTIVFQSINDRGWHITTMGFGGIYTFDLTYEFMLVSFHGNVFQVNGNSYTTTQQWGTNYTQFKFFALFGCYNTSTKVVDCQSCKIGRCDLYVNNELAYSFIPVRVGVGKDAVGYMYEQISGQYYGNQGAGKFIIGPDVRR